MSLKFNLSHSKDVALFGFTLDCEIGLDLESLDSIRDFDEIAARFFCADETAQLLSVSASCRKGAFIRCWTRKEAYLKAIGKGLHEPLDSFCVSVLPGVPARLIHIRGSFALAEEWALHDIDSIPGYSGALAYRDVRRPIRVGPLVSASDLLDLVTTKLMP